MSLTQRQLEFHLWGAAELLRGQIDSSDYKQYIFPLFFLKRLCGVWDEETQQALEESGGDRQYALFPENHRFNIPPEAHWKRLRDTTKGIGQKLAASFRAIEKANDRLFGIFGDAAWTNQDRLPDRLLGEMRRVLNSFLVFIERLRSNSLVIAATNHGDRLDKALFRRFDDLIEFGLPREPQVRETIRTLLTGVKTARLSWKQLFAAAQGLSYSEITRACEEAIKDMLIGEKPEITTDMLLAALTERRLYLNH